MTNKICLWRCGSWRNPQVHRCVVILQSWADRCPGGTAGLYRPSPELNRMLSVNSSVAGDRGRLFAIRSVPVIDAVFAAAAKVKRLRPGDPQCSRHVRIESQRLGAVRCQGKCGGESRGISLPRRDPIHPRSHRGRFRRPTRRGLRRSGEPRFWHLETSRESRQPFRSFWRHP